MGNIAVFLRAIPAFIFPYMELGRPEPNHTFLLISHFKHIEWHSFEQAPSRDCLGDLQKQSAVLMKSEQPVFSILNSGISEEKPA